MKPTIIIFQKRNKVFDNLAKKSELIFEPFNLAIPAHIFAKQMVRTYGNRIDGTIATTDESSVISAYFAQYAHLHFFISSKYLHLTK